MVRKLKEKQSFFCIRQKGAYSLTVLKLTMILTFLTLMVTIYSIKLNISLSEEILIDPSIPLLQSISYSTVDLESEQDADGNRLCVGASNCKEVKVYELMGLAAAANSAEVNICGGLCNVELIVSSRLSKFETEFGGLGLVLRNETRETVFETGRTPSKVEEEGGRIRGISATQYVLPLPTKEGKAKSAYFILTEVETE